MEISARDVQVGGGGWSQSVGIYASLLGQLNQASLVGRLNEYILAVVSAVTREEF